MQGGRNTPSPSESLQPPIPGKLARPTFLQGTAAHIMPPPQVPSPIGFPKGVSSDSANPQSMQKDQSIKSNTTADVAQETCTASTTTSVRHYVSQPSHTNSNFASSAPNLGPTTFWAPSVPSFQVPLGVSQTHATHCPPGLSPAPVSSNVTIPSPFVNSSSALLRPIGPAAPVPSNPAIQQETFPSYPSVPPVLTTPQGLWLRPQQMSGLPRPPLLPYPAAFPGPFPLSTHGMQLPYVPLPDSQPPGVTPVGAPGGSSIFSAASGKQSAIISVMEPELPPGIDNNTHVNDVSIKDRALISEQLDAWTAHRTETGAVYYYNAVTGESTYEKPSDFKGETLQAATMALVGYREPSLFSVSFLGETWTRP